MSMLYFAFPTKKFITFQNKMFPTTKICCDSFEKNMYLSATKQNTILPSNKCQGAIINFLETVHPSI